MVKLKFTRLFLLFLGLAFTGYSQNNALQMVEGAGNIPVYIFMKGTASASAFIIINQSDSAGIDSRTNAGTSNTSTKNRIVAQNTNGFNYVQWNTGATTTKNYRFPFGTDAAGTNKFLPILWHQTAGAANSTVTMGEYAADASNLTAPTSPTAVSLESVWGSNLGTDAIHRWYSIWTGGTAPTASVDLAFASGDNDMATSDVIGAQQWTPAFARSIACITNSTTTVTSAGLFLASDVGNAISGSGIPVGATVATFVDINTITLSAAATSSLNPVTLTIAQEGWNSAVGSATVTAATGGTVTIPSMSTFNSSTSSGAWLLTRAPVPLPVKLADFAARCTKNKMLVKWATSSETNNNFFTLERSVDGTEYSTVKTVPGAGTTSMTHTYAYTDDSAPEGTTYYRLKQTDFDGNTKTFKPISANCDGSSTASGVTVYPNPTVNGQNIIVELSGFQSEEDVAVNLIDGLGQVVFSQKIATDINGSAVYEIEAGNFLGAGVYTVLSASNTQSFKQRLLVNR